MKHNRTLSVVCILSSLTLVWYTFRIMNTRQRECVLREVTNKIFLSILTTAYHRITFVLVWSCKALSLLIKPETLRFQFLWSTGIAYPVQSLLCPSLIRNSSYLDCAAVPTVSLVSPFDGVSVTFVWLLWTALRSTYTLLKLETIWTPVNCCTV